MEIEGLEIFNRVSSIWYWRSFVSSGREFEEFRDRDSRKFAVGAPVFASARRGKCRALGTPGLIKTKIRCKTREIAAIESARNIAGVTGQSERGPRSHLNSIRANVRSARGEAGGEQEAGPGARQTGGRNDRKRGDRRFPGRPEQIKQYNKRVARSDELREGIKESAGRCSSAWNFQRMIIGISVG